MLSAILCAALAAAPASAASARRVLTTAASWSWALRAGRHVRVDDKTDRFVPGWNRSLQDRTSRVPARFYAAFSVFIERFIRAVFAKMIFNEIIGDFGSGSPGA